MASSKINSRNWSAVEATDDIAGNNRHIEVSGEIETSRSNQRASLSEAKPQGINPKILILDLQISSEGDIGNDVIGWTSASFRKPVEAGQYESVEIHRDGTKVASVPVKQRPS